MVDALIVGAGPAGAMAATVLARAGARVLVVERTNRAQIRICGGILHSSARMLLTRFGLSTSAAVGVELEGLVLTGPAGARLAVPYDAGHAPRAVDRRALDASILTATQLAGARVERGVEARELLYVSHAGHRTVRGALLRLESGRTLRVPAGVTIFADGSHSPMARALGLVRPVASPARWAMVGVLDGLEGLQSRAEWHFRRDGVFSVTPMGSGQAQLCWVGPGITAPKTSQIVEALSSDPAWRERVSRARWVEFSDCSRVASVRPGAAGVAGLLLAGDAAAPAEPLFADGLHAAMHGGVLAGEEALRELEVPTGLAHRRLQSRLVRDSVGSWSSANVGRTIASSSAALTMAAVGARLVPGLAHRLVHRWTRAGATPRER